MMVKLHADISKILGTYLRPGTIRNGIGERKTVPSVTVEKTMPSRVIRSLLSTPQLSLNGILQW